MVIVGDAPRIPPKRIKFKQIVNDGEADRMSALPDCLLVEILSRLPSTKDAIRTGALSKRWKDLWTWVTTLIFTQDYLQNHKSRSDFVSFVDKTLTQCRQLKLKKLKVYTSYDMKLESHINSWIRYAMSCNIEELDITSWSNSGSKFLLDQKVFITSCFNDIRLAGCVFNASGAISWKILRSLYIADGKLSEVLIENMLSGTGSPLLESLVLDYCSGYRRLNITSKSVKNLVISGYRSPPDIIEIIAPNIQSLKIQYGLWLWKLLLIDVSSLVEAYLDYFKLGRRETTREEVEEYMLIGFLLNLRHVKELKIGSICAQALSRLEAKGFVVPSNVRLV